MGKFRQDEVIMKVATYDCVDGCDVVKIQVNDECERV